MERSQGGIRVINILKDIFKKNEYRVEDAFNDINQIGFIGSINKLDRKDYYLVIDVNMSTITNNLIDGIIDKIIKSYWNIDLLKKYGVGSDYKKNTSLILLVKVDSVNDEYELSNKIYDIEESPYFFKRYVILYTEEQKKLIEKIEIEKYLDILSNKDNFRNYKKNKKGEENFNSEFKENELIYDIISKLYIKIPFLVYNFNDNEKLPILRERINKILDNDQKNIVNTLVSIDLENDTYYKNFNDILRNPTEEEIKRKYDDILLEISNENY